jgi:hypothetical protein
VQVTAADKQMGVGTNIEYPSEKPPFVPGSLAIDPDGHLWVERYAVAGAPKLEWDVFDGTGRRLGTAITDHNREIVGFGRRFVYVIYTDADELQWLEAYKR